MSTHSGYRYLWERLIHIRGARAVWFLLLSGGIFAAIAAAIHLPILTEIDRRVTLELQEGRSMVLDLLFFTASFLGNSLTLILVCAITALIVLRKGYHHMAFLIALTLLSLPLNMLIKNWAVRPRPDADAVAILLPAVGLSFPSGHAMGATVVYGFLAAMVWMRANPGHWRTAGTYVLGILPIVIALSRIYLGAHWLSDVIAGMAAGAFLLVPLVSLYKHWHNPENPTNTAPAPTDHPPA